MINKCIFVKSMNFGGQVFYFRYSEPEKGKFDYDTVWVYADAQMKKMIMGCHVSKIIPLADNVNIDKFGGSRYVSTASFNKLHDVWDDE